MWGRVCRSWVIVCGGSWWHCVRSVCCLVTGANFFGGWAVCEFAVSRNWRGDGVLERGACFLLRVRIGEGEVRGVVSGVLVLLVGIRAGCVSRLVVVSIWCWV